ncbi:hypothetical protein [Treponema pedis]|uniref:Uncharacterized protein n=2 Tax=Treponema pedis TaxID=409322 RepID=S5ZXX2_9SPIR|nr:hypothetical protein [Treponema pedis]AGT42823.1 hypothetical protein TPE_0327 [Treponema pedis str. T A4]
MRIKKIFFFLTLFICFTAFAETTKEQNLILTEYTALLNRIKYSKQSGFCFDGTEFIAETETEGSEHSFFVAEKNIYIKVVNTEDKNTYFTRCFDIKEEVGYLAVNSKFKLQPSIPVTGHWNFIKIGKKLNVTVCTDETCRNIEITLYEINEKPLDVKDGIFFTFKKGAEKKAKNVNITLNAKALPSINIEKEKKEADIILKKMEAYFSKEQINAKKEELKKIF